MWGICDRCLGGTLPNRSDGSPPTPSKVHHKNKQRQKRIVGKVILPSPAAMMVHPQKNNFLMQRDHGRRKKKRVTDPDG